MRLVTPIRHGRVGSRKGFNQTCNATTQVEIAHFVHTVEQDDDSSGSQVRIKEIAWHCDALSLQVGMQEGEESPVAFDAVIAGVVSFEIGTKIAQRQEDRQRATLWQPEAVPNYRRTFGAVASVAQGQVAQKCGLARARVSQHHQAPVRGKCFLHGDCHCLRVGLAVELLPFAWRMLPLLG